MPESGRRHRRAPMRSRLLITTTVILIATALTLARRVTPAVARTPGAPVRILVYHDMEGLAGQDDWRTFLFSHPERYPEGQKMLAADLNAVIDGLFARGATQVDVAAAHGSGNPPPAV